MVIGCVYMCTGLSNICFKVTWHDGEVMRRSIINFDSDTDEIAIMGARYWVWHGGKREECYGIFGCVDRHLHALYIDVDLA